MTPPKNPSTFTDAVLLRELRRRVRDDDRADFLLDEVEHRLRWRSRTQPVDMLDWRLSRAEEALERLRGEFNLGRREPHLSLIAAQEEVDGAE